MPRKKQEPAYTLSKTLLQAINPAQARYRVQPPSHEGQGLVPQDIVDGTLPILPEYLRDFAFRAALENRSQRDWADIYHVSPGTIYQWLSRKDVLKFITTIRYERRLQLSEAINQAESKALKRLNDILDQKVNTANMTPMLNAIFRTLMMTREGKVSNSGDGQDVNLNLTLNQFSDNRSITVDDRAAIESRLEELNMIEKVLDTSTSDKPRMIEATLDTPPRKRKRETVKGAN